MVQFWPLKVDVQRKELDHKCWLTIQPNHKDKIFSWANYILLFTTLTLILLFWLRWHLSHPENLDVQNKKSILVCTTGNQSANKDVSISFSPSRCTSIQEYTSFFNNVEYRNGLILSNSGSDSLNFVHFFYKIRRLSILVVKFVVIINQSRTLIHVIASLEVHLPLEAVAVGVSMKKSLKTQLCLPRMTEPSAGR